MTRRKEDLTTLNSPEEKTKTLVLYKFSPILYLKGQPVSGFAKG